MSKQEGLIQQLQRDLINWRDRYASLEVSHVLALDEIGRLRKELEDAHLRLLSFAGDDLCHLTQQEIDDIAGGKIKIPPLEVFIPSCIRFHQRHAAENGTLENCYTLAQLGAENERLRRENEKLNGLVTTTLPASLPESESPSLASAPHTPAETISEIPQPHRSSQ